MLENVPFERNGNASAKQEDNSDGEVTEPQI
jgi:hypothetical protein